MVKRIIIYILIFFCGGVSLNAQEVTVEGFFLQDTVKIGEAIHYAILVTYPLNKEVILPDSIYDFGPFEYISRSYKPTRVVGDMAIDTVTYELTSFEIDPVLYLKLPAFVITKKDSIPIFSNVDSVLIASMVPVLSDSLEVISNTLFTKVATQINYPLIAILLVAFLILAGAVYLLFGGVIRKKIRLRRIRKAYRKFSEQFEQKLSDLRKQPSSALAEDTIGLWKKYMESLEDKPYTKLTTKELMRLGLDEKIKDVLKKIDSSIYGRKQIAQIHTSFETLEDFTSQRYQAKIKEVDNE